MVDKTISDLDPVSGLDGGELVEIEQDSGSAYTTVQAIADLAAAAGVDNSICDVRLSLTSATPVTTGDVTAATNVYATLYKGDKTTLWDGAAWALYTLVEMAIPVPATTSTPFDVFQFSDSGDDVDYETVNWTNDTTRATAITPQNGTLVKSGDATRKYIGTCRTTTVSGQTEDSLAKRYVWNYYNRVKRPVRASEATASWNYSAATWRQVRATATNQVDTVVGVAEDEITLHANATATSSTSTARAVLTGIGVNSTSANSAQILGQAAVSSVAAYCPYAHYSGIPAAGRTYYPWLEYGAATDTQTFYGSGTSNVQSAIFGVVMA